MSEDNVASKLSELRKTEPDTVLMIVRTRIMMEQRGITLQQLARQLGTSHRWIRMVLSGDLMGSEGRRQWLDRIDDAIDEILYPKGGTSDGGREARRTSSLD